jgi:hypothetical protein
MTHEELNIMEYIVNLLWDGEAGVWYSRCDGIPLTLESPSLDDLIARVTLAAPELLELNGKPAGATLRFLADRRAEIA